MFCIKFFRDKVLHTPCSARCLMLAFSDFGGIVRVGGKISRISRHLKRRPMRSGGISVEIERKL